MSPSAAAPSKSESTPTSPRPRRWPARLGGDWELVPSYAAQADRVATQLNRQFPGSGLSGSAYRKRDVDVSGPTVVVLAGNGDLPAATTATQLAGTAARRTGDKGTFCAAAGDTSPRQVCVTAAGPVVVLISTATAGSPAAMDAAAAAQLAEELHASLP